MEDSSLSVQLKKNTTRDQKFFVYKDKKYPFNFNLFKNNSNYFYKNRKILKKVKEINLLNEYEEDNIEMSAEIIKSFISSCQNEVFEINVSNAIELQFLSMKYEVDDLISITNEYIEKNHKSLLLKSFLFKTRHLRTIKGSENINYDTSNEEEIISKHLYEYINDKEITFLPIETFDRILKKHFKNNNNEVKDKKDEKDKEDEIIKILFSYLDKYGREASILFSNVDFSQQRVEVMNCLLHKYSNIFDFSMINSTLLKTTSEILSEMSKMKAEYSKNIFEMKELFREQQEEIQRVKKEYLNMKEQEEKRNEERERLFEQEIKQMKDEMKKQRTEFESELQRMKNKQNEILNSNKIDKYQEILRDTITNSEYQNLNEESKQYIFDEIIQNQNHNQEQNTNQNKSIQKSPDCLSNQISCMMNFVKQTRIFDNNEEQEIEFIKENINKPNISFDMIERLYENKQIERNIFEMMNNFSEIIIEIKYPSKSYQGMIDLFSKMNEKHCNEFRRIKLCIDFSNVECIEYDHQRNQLINEIKIDSTVKKINDNAFLGCPKLRVVEISEGVNEIGSNAFSSCLSLTRVSLPNSITLIKISTFAFCKSLKEILIPSSVTKIESCAFKGCNKLSSISLPSSLKSVGENVFHNCMMLNIAGDINFIQSYTFKSCESLTKIVIPPSVTRIGKSAFENCYSLACAIIPPSVTTIDESAFCSCYSLADITFPSSLIKIGNHAFCQCSSLKQVLIPSSVNSIGICAFSYCQSLKEISIPPSVTSLKNDAFQYCHSLKRITIPSSLSNIELYGISSDVEIIKT